MYANEIYVKIRGKLKYIFVMMDDETRFWIVQAVVDRKEGHDTRGLLQKSKQVTQIKPKVLITDGLESYYKTYKKEFGLSKDVTERYTSDTFTYKAAGLVQ